MNLKIEDFEGPLDLLLHLVRISEMDIYRVNIKEIIDQYLLFIESIDKYDIDKSSEYLVMASELIHLKSKMLVNKDIDDKEDIIDSDFEINSEEELRNKLINYEKYKNITETFKVLKDNRNDYYTKLPEDLKEFSEGKVIINNDVTMDDLINAFLELQKRIDLKKPLTTKITRKEYSVKEKVEEIRNKLKDKESIEFNELFDEYTKENFVVTFLSILDMSKNKEIYLKQDRVFSNIIINRGNVWN